MALFDNFLRPTLSPPSPPFLALLIEDEECVANLVERILSRMGKRVLRARDGAEGAQLFAQYETEIALVVLDCGLPDVDGAALGRVLRQHAPTLPLILTSGWDNVLARALAEEGPTVFLPKPFSTSQVLEHVSALVSVSV